MKLQADNKENIKLLINLLIDLLARENTPSLDIDLNQSVRSVEVHTWGNPAVESHPVAIDYTIRLDYTLPVTLDKDKYLL